MTSRRRIKFTKHPQRRILRHLFTRFPRQYQILRHFALRNINGRPTTSLPYPFFASGPSHEALLLNLPVPVCSCWHSMMAFDAALFLLPSNFRFSGMSDSLAEWHVVGSESCLIHYNAPG
ncbi:hypothetical protein B9Z19DRAFT_1095425 [Tuber borchii]|uniref:Uncharacterized protein n=1 Tax=Tuber borchii TaxID=42251 RepID=A0A2T6ZCS8_TUBBO|nr:hypothetical protein B9Z19DRAFT_1095425 [Tuber borchii]